MISARKLRYLLEENRQVRTESSLLQYYRRLFATFFYDTNEIVELVAFNLKGIQKESVSRQQYSECTQEAIVGCKLVPLDTRFVHVCFMILGELPTPDPRPLLFFEKYRESVT